jgi:hypothetical protein
LGFEFNALRVAIFKPYPIIAYIAPAIWLGLGCEWILNRLPQTDLKLHRVLPIVIIVVVGATNFSDNNRSNNRFAELYGEQVLAATPQGAVLFAEGDNGVGLLGYLQTVEHRRPDVELRSWNNLVFSNRLMTPFSPDDVQARQRIEFIDNASRPVFSTLNLGRLLINQGIVFEHHHAPEIPPNKVTAFACSNGELHEYIRYLIRVEHEQYLTDGHERSLLFSLLLGFTRQHVGLIIALEVTAPDELAMLTELQTTYAGKIATLETLIGLPQNDTTRKNLRDMADDILSQMPPDESRKVAGLVHQMHGQLMLREPVDLQAALKKFEASVERYPTADDNPAICALYRLHKQLGSTAQGEQLLARYGVDECD